MKKTLFFIAILLVNLFLAGCAGIGGPSHGRPPVSRNIQKITLMLPLNGVYAAQSQAIKNGFLAAYYEGQQAGQNLNINIVDTTGKDVATLYKEAVASGSDMVVGPLTKNEVNRLTTLSKLSTPILALNTLHDYKRKVIPNLYQFGLSPQDDIIEVANKISKDGYNNIAMIYPASVWGQTLANKFKSNYVAEGGRIVGQMSYANPANFDAQVRELMQVDQQQFDAARDIREDQKNNVEVSHRQDIDAIFLLAYPREARQIVPLLKFYYADKIPIYATSTIYSGTPQPNLDQDLNGVKFCDIPWVVSPSGALPQYLQNIRYTINSTWPKSAVKYSKLYALGVDAYTLAVSFNSLIAAPNKGIAGATGGLYLDAHNHIYRTLRWTTMRQGQPGI